MQHIPPKRLHHSPAGDDQGFTLIESLVAAVLLAVAASAAFTLFTSSEVSFQQSRRKDNDQVAINQDLARIERLNRRFVCFAGSCNFIADGNPDPNELEYTPPYPPRSGSTPPDLTDFNAKMDTFNATCADPGGLAEEFTEQAVDELGSDEFGETVNGIPLKRTFDITTPTLEPQPTPHAYNIVYSRDNVVLRRARLVPTVANWCP